MKKISILAIVVIAVLIGISMVEVGKGVVDGWNEAGGRRDTSYDLVTLERITLRVNKKDQATTDSLYNSALKEYVPSRTESITTFVKESTLGQALYVLMFPIALLAVYGFYCLIRLLISVVRKEVFVRKNVRRMRIFYYSFILVSFIIELNLYIAFRSAVSQLELTGYEVSYSTKVPLLYLMLLALFTEIFAAGVRLKEEQDLTI